MHYFNELLYVLGLIENKYNCKMFIIIMSAHSLNYIQQYYLKTFGKI